MCTCLTPLGARSTGKRSTNFSSASAASDTTSIPANQIQAGTHFTMWRSGTCWPTRSPGPSHSRDSPKNAGKHCLGVIAAWESKVCSEDCSPNLRMALGSFLLAAHTSMRFGDTQRIKVDQLSLTAHALRGLCWATKTTKLGQPFACTLFGLTGRSAQSSWALRWLHCMSVAFQHSTSKPLNLPAPDFILPAFARVEDTAHPSFAGPMAHARARPSALGEPRRSTGIHFA